MEIETKKASLNTLAVTIQALHVNGKQMTLAVFRQLPETDAFSGNGTLAESLIPWGLVRYQIKGRGNQWLVASKENKLFRCPFILYREDRESSARSDLSWALSEHNKKVDALSKNNESFRWQYLSDDSREEVISHQKEEIEAASRVVSINRIRLAQASTREKTYANLLDTLPHLFIAV